VILIDTSAWIEFQLGTDSWADHRVTAAIEADEPLATIGLVQLELLAGARDERQAHALSRLLGRCEFLPLHEAIDYRSAAAMYRECRRRGTTIRRLPDCLIAAVAIRADLELLHQDADFDAIALHWPVRTVGRA
jgi:predicted nucleic acid-binding protein